MSVTRFWRIFSTILSLSDMTGKAEKSNGDGDGDGDGDDNEEEEEAIEAKLFVFLLSGLRSLLLLQPFEFTEE